MNWKKLLSVMFLAAMAGVFVLPANASDANQQTKVTFENPIEIPGHVLPAGTYWFVQDTSDLNLVRIFSPDWKKLYATEITIPSERLDAVTDSTFTFAENPSAPEALLTWFYPGQALGHEFRYSRQEEKALTQNQRQTIVAPWNSLGQHAGF